MTILVPLTFEDEIPDVLVLCPEEEEELPETLPYPADFLNKLNENKSHE